MTVDGRLRSDELHVTYLWIAAKLNIVRSQEVIHQANGIAFLAIPLKSLIKDLYRTWFRINSFKSLISFR